MGMREAAGSAWASWAGAARQLGRGLGRSRRRLSPARRVRMEALAAAMLPAGRILPAAGAREIARLEAALSPTAMRLLGNLFWRLDQAAILRTGRRFHRLPAGKQQALLRAWASDPVMRWPIFLLASTLALLHYDCPEYYRALACTFDKSGPAEPARWLRQVERGSELGGEHEIECDVVVVGTGAGGAVVGKELAEKGYAVVFLEEGKLHRRDAFNGRALDAFRRFYRSDEGLVSVGNTGVPIMVGRLVGGSTAINGGTWCRALPGAMERWAEELGLHELGPDALAPYYERVEAQLDVGVTKEAYLGRVPDLVQRGCRRLGWSSSLVVRNAPQCDGQGACLWGCPTDAKRSTNVSYVPWALERGALLYTELRAERVLIEDGRAVGMRARARTSDATVSVRARAVVLACGALHTPALLLGQGLANRSGQVGRNLKLHPATTVSALFDEDLVAHNAVPQAILCDEFRNQGILIYEASPSPDVGALSFAFTGRELVDLMDDYQRVATVTVITIDQSSGRVRSGPGGRPLVTYWLGRSDLERIHVGVVRAARIFHAAGARRIFPLYHGRPAVDGTEAIAALGAMHPGPRDMVLTSVHPLGTCRMGVDPLTSVVGPSHEAHDLPGLFVVDASALPTTPGVNPQCTIMALATRAADQIAERLG